MDGSMGGHKFTRNLFIYVSISMSLFRQMDMDITRYNLHGTKKANNKKTILKMRHENT